MISAIDTTLNTMSGSYLNRFKLSESDKLTWREGLHGFSAEVLGHAVNDARIDFPEWPPTLMEFRHYCIKQKRSDNQSEDTDRIVIYNKWAKDHGFDQHKPGESADAFQRRLNMSFEIRRKRHQADGAFRSSTYAELSEVIETNRAANDANDFASRHK